MRADPVTRPEYAKSKKLQLYLRKIEKMDPAKILFSLPSICDQIPPLGIVPLSGNDYVLHEDDWRQLEFVSQQFAQETTEEIEAIRQIHEQHAAEYGWRKIHVRSRLAIPISSHLTIHEVAQGFGLSSNLSGVSYSKANNRIESGYSFTAKDGQKFYGLEADGIVTVLAVAREKLSSTPFDSIELARKIASKFGLDLVAWCKCERSNSSDPRFKEILAGNAS